MMSLKPIGQIYSPFREKFGTPRQANIVPAVEMQLRLLPPYDQVEAVRGLEQFSHIWVLFWFHQVPVNESFQPLVRPPRLGGNDKVGVFASRSPFRPNSIGLSLLELMRINVDDGVILHLRGGDLVDGTPVLDIKPYIPYADSAENPRAGFASHAPVKLAVEWSDAALHALKEWCDSQQQSAQHWHDMIEQTLAQDPRPAYHDEPEREYGVTLGQLNIRFMIYQDAVKIITIQLL
jgi:tRNA-Thr(GGU) m(6)t(6)A37 methyltransferase TsaA